ncbi:MAG: porin, partial [Burkholderiaceae bacterium]
MKKTLIALAALGVVGAASAQVTISGAAMVALQKGSLTGNTTSFATPDFDINFAANEDLGGGLSVSVATGIT